MLRALLVLAATAAALVAALPATRGAAPLITQSFVDEINARKGMTWRAELPARFAGKTEAELRTLMGVRPLEENPSLEAHYEPVIGADADVDAALASQIPASFDAREHWPECAGVIGTIADQSACGSCWAVSTASSMSDRLCIGTKGALKAPLSSIDIVGCCGSCGYGCEGGYPEEAWRFGVNEGVVSGSGHANNTGCKPYPFAECAHHSPHSKLPACPSDIYDTPSCSSQCQNDYKLHAYKQDKFHFKSVQRYSRSVPRIQREIMQNGPVVFTYSVYTDFMAYSDGIYQHTSGRFAGGHAVRAIGWGTENGTDYWLIANSWNTDWAALGGYFKIVRGKNDCDIESRITAAVIDKTRMPAKY